MEGENEAGRVSEGRREGFGGTEGGLRGFEGREVRQDTVEVQLLSAIGFPSTVIVCSFAGSLARVCLPGVLKLGFDCLLRLSGFVFRVTSVTAGGSWNVQLSAR